MKQITSYNVPEELPVNYFYQAVHIYLSKTQVVNRKLSCSANLVFLKINKLESKYGDFELITKLPSHNGCESLSSEDVINLFKSEKIEFSEGQLDDLRTFDGSDEEIFISIDRLTPRDLKKFSICLQATIIDTRSTSATIHPLNNSSKLLPPLAYELSYSKTNSTITLKVEDEAPEESSNWLQFVLVGKIQNWMVQCSEGLQSSGSNQLINAEDFNKTYAVLKEKYGQALEKNWEESTDPKKFIYEDIAIASYLICLWKQGRSEGEELQSFADLGCGNGLLVFILSQEGHRGYGVDLRKRKIWDKLPALTDLREIAIVPSDENLFSDVDWIIGNHSDELSPWIPVISARSSHKSKYFLLPCCAFEFSGAKFQKRGNKSQYLSFIDYLVTVSEACGFQSTKIDRLKIPSTKRICIIGSGRDHTENDFHRNCEKIQNFINLSSPQQGTSGKWSESFKPRDKIEVVRNCTKIEKSLSEAIVKKIFDHLLSMKESFCNEFPGWNCGASLLVPEAVALVTSDDLKKLKSECGGLQTLMRNKHQIFQVTGGAVSLRIPRRVSEMKFDERTLKRNVVKTSPCYFFRHHPGKCPLPNDDCSYIH